MIHPLAAPCRRAAGIFRVATPLAVVALAVSVLLFLPPDQHNFYPQCPVYHTLHILCPGCGSTRAVAALLRGHIAQAFLFNTLTTVMLPIITAYAAGCYKRFIKREPLQLPHLPAAAIYAVLIVAAGFTIVRNLAQ